MSDIFEIEEMGEDGAIRVWYGRTYTQSHLNNLPPLVVTTETLANDPRVPSTWVYVRYLGFGRDYWRHHCADGGLGEAIAERGRITCPRCAAYRDEDGRAY